MMQETAPDMLARQRHAPLRREHVPMMATRPARNGQGICRRLCGLLVLLLALVLMPLGAKAQTGCYYDSSSDNQTPVNYNPPSTLTVNFNTPVGAVLWQSGPVNPSNPPVVDCFNTVTTVVVNNAGATPGTTTDVYPTSVAGLSYEIIHNSSSNTGPLYPWPCCSSDQGGGNSITFSVPSTLKLVKTGKIATGSTLPAGVLGYWQWQGGDFGPDLQVEAFTLASPVTFVDPACSVVTNPVVVTLPTTSTRMLTTQGATTGTTSFAISLNCPSGASGMTLSVQLDYNGRASGKPGVLLPTSGSSSGFGVQLLDQNSTPVTFGTPEVVGTTPSGVMNIPYFAQYYRTTRTGRATRPGTLTASATFTLSYQ